MRATPKWVLHVTPPASSLQEGYLAGIWGWGQQKVLRATTNPLGTTCTGTAAGLQAQGLVAKSLPRLRAAIGGAPTLPEEGL